MLLPSTFSGNLYTNPLTAFGGNLIILEVQLLQWFPILDLISRIAFDHCLLHLVTMPASAFATNQLISDTGVQLSI